MLAPLTAACLTAAAYAYQIPESYLYAILATEGGKVGQAIVNRNGTKDLGPFQINSIWGPVIGRFWGISAEDALVHVRDDGCASAVVAAAILRQCTTDARGDLPKALGLYHSPRPELAKRYREKVMAAVVSIYMTTAR